MVRQPRLPCMPRARNGGSYSAASLRADDKNLSGSSSGVRDARRGVSEEKEIKLGPKLIAFDLFRLPVKSGLPVPMTVEEKPKDYSKTECDHKRVWIDFSGGTLQCRDCQAYLDAFAHLTSMVRDASYYDHQREVAEEYEVRCAQNTKAAALEMLLSYGVTPEEYSSFWAGKAEREKNVELIKGEFEKMVRLHFPTLYGRCVPATQYAIRKLRRGKEHFDIHCFVCNCYGSSKVAPAGMPIFNFIPRKFERFRSDIIRKVRAELEARTELQRP